MTALADTSMRNTWLYITSRLQQKPVMHDRTKMLSDSNTKNAYLRTTFSVIEFYIKCRAGWSYSTTMVRLMPKGSLGSLGSGGPKVLMPIVWNTSCVSVMCMTWRRGQIITSNKMHNEKHTNQKSYFAIVKMSWVRRVTIVYTCLTVTVNFIFTYRLPLDVWDLLTAYRGLNICLPLTVMPTLWTKHNGTFSSPNGMGTEVSAWKSVHPKPRVDPRLLGKKTDSAKKQGRSLGDHK